MAGTFGLEGGELRPVAGGRPADAGRIAPGRAVLFGSTECSTCRLQMEDGAGKRTLHPAQYLALAYGLMPGVAAAPAGTASASWCCDDACDHSLVRSRRDLAGADVVRRLNLSRRPATGGRSARGLLRSAVSVAWQRSIAAFRLLPSNERICWPTTVNCMPAEGAERRRCCRRVSGGLE